MVKGLILAASIVVLSACASAPTDTFCDVAKPFRFSAEAVDRMSDEEVRDALAHNKKGAALCGWKP